MLLKIGTLDVTPWLTAFDVEYETLLSKKGSGRNARGNNVVDIVNKKDKLICQFAPMTETEMKTFLAAIEAYVLDITYLNPKSLQLKTIRAYTGTPKVGILHEGSSGRIMKGFPLNFIEM